MADRPKVLILGGTAEAVELANTAAADLDITYSLAGRTRTPALPADVTVRSGGFGGAVALTRWLTSHRIAAVVDATHPFADTIARNAVLACVERSLPHLKLMRPPWEPLSGDDWHVVPDIASAATALQHIGGRAFLSVGRQELGAFAGIEGVALVIRSIDPPESANPLPEAVYLTGRGPFTFDRETDLLKANDIDVVVSKNAGGDATYAKIAAARALSIPVVMVARPAPPPGATVGTVDAALDWLNSLETAT